MDNITGYTPGKWEVVTDLAAQLFPNEIFIAVRNEKGIFEHPICDVFLMNNKDGKANASLIAAAPSLYEENKKLKKEGNALIDDCIKYEKTIKVLREQVRVLREVLMECRNEISSHWDINQPNSTTFDLHQKATAALSQTETK